MKTLGDLRKWMEENRALRDDISIRVYTHEWDGDFTLNHYCKMLFERPDKTQFIESAHILIEEL